MAKHLQVTFVKLLAIEALALVVADVPMVFAGIDRNNHVKSQALPRFRIVCISGLAGQKAIL